MDNVALQVRLEEGARELGLELPPGAPAKLLRYLEELLRWNAKVNLTAIRGAEEAVELHLLDSLAVLPEVGGARSLLDVGAGGGLPGIPLKIARPQMELALADAVAKKVGFLKAAVAVLGLAGARAMHVRAEGDPEREGLPRAEVVICRAFLDLEQWAVLSRKYVVPGGRAIAMLGKAPAVDLQALAARAGFSAATLRAYALPFSKAERHVAAFE